MLKAGETVEKQKVREKIQNFAQVVSKFYNKELTIPEYKHISGSFGTYSERNHNTGMLRLRIPAGILKMNILMLVLMPRLLQIF